MPFVFVFLAVSVAMAQTEGKPIVRKEAHEATPPRTVAPDDPEPRELGITKTLPVRELGRGGVYSLSACDADRNIYVRVTVSNVLADPFERYTANGEKKAEFKLPSTPDLDFIAFGPTIGGDGSIYFPAAAYKKGMKFRDAYVLKYSKDGELKNTIHIDAPVSPRLVVGFKDGTLLVSGTQLPTDEDPSRTTAYLALFSEDGKLIKRMTLPEDDELKNKADLGDITVTAGVNKGFNSSVEFSNAIVGSDGNCYFTRATSAPTVYVISPSGEVLRSFKVDSGAPGLFAGWLHESSGYLAIYFTRVYSAAGGGPPRVLKVVDMMTGDSVANYNSMSIIGEPLCFSYPGEFIFAGYKDRKFAFTFAQPK